jgi:CheY-like chemotaxis protein
MPKILIVEDEAPQRKALHENLATKGFSILEARDGVEGLKTALREHPDIIILDVRMPKMDGMAMMHELRADAWGRTAAIIVLTNYDTDDTQLKQIATDMPAFFLLKASITLDQILEKIHIVLDKKQTDNPFQ